VKIVSDFVVGLTVATLTHAPDLPDLAGEIAAAATNGQVQSQLKLLCDAEFAVHCR